MEGLEGLFKDEYCCKVVSGSLPPGVCTYAGQLLCKDLVVSQVIHMLYEEGYAYLHHKISKMKSNHRAKGTP